MTEKQPIAVGDVVTWGKAVEPGAKTMHMRVRGCKVIKLGHIAEDTGEPAAIIEAMGEQLAVRVADLERED